MRILQVTKWYIPYRGGVETVVEQLSQGVSQADEDVRVLTCHHKPHFSDTQEVLDGIEVTRCQSFGNYFGTPASVTYPFRYRTLVEESDIVHFHAPFPVGELTYSLGDLCDKKVVVTLHADPAGTRFAVLERLYRPVIRRLLDRADRIIVTSPQLRDTPELLAGIRAKCSIIPLAANVSTNSIASHDVASFRKEKGLSDRNVILGVGRMVYYKGFKFVVEALPDLDAELVLIGRGEDTDDLRAQAERLGVCDRLHMPGYVAAEELPMYYAAADVFVFPSISPAEAFGIVQVEAMSHGLPVVNTSLPTGVPFVSKDGETGLTVEPKNVPQLRRALSQILSDDEMRSRFAQNARDRAETFSMTAFLTKHLDLYRSLH